MNTHPTQSLTNVGDYLEYPVPNTTIKIRVEHVHGGFYLYVQQSTRRVEELCTPFPGETADSERLARGTANSLAEGLKAGISIRQFIADRQAAEAGLIASINRTMDAVEAKHQADADADQKAAAETVSPDRTGWARFADEARRNARTITGRAATLTHVQLRALNSVDVNGVVRVGPGIAKPTLEGLEARGYGRCLRGGSNRRRYEITGFVANERGLNARTEVAA